MGRLGGKSTSEAKAKAVRKNGAKGGRPPEKEVEQIYWEEANGGSYRVIKGTPARFPLLGARTIRGWLQKRGSSVTNITWEMVGEDLYLGWFSLPNGDAYRIVEKQK